MICKNWYKHFGTIISIKHQNLYISCFTQFAKFIKIIQSVPNQTVSAKMAFLVKEMS